MYTQCPECQTVFQVTPADLAVAAGTVRCGECGDAFNALLTLSETPFGFKPPSLSNRRGATDPDAPPPAAAARDALPDAGAGGFARDYEADPDEVADDYEIVLDESYRTPPEDAVAPVDDDAGEPQPGDENDEGDTDIADESAADADDPGLDQDAEPGGEAHVRGEEDEGVDQRDVPADAQVLGEGDDGVDQRDDPADAQALGEEDDGREDDEDIEATQGHHDDALAEDHSDESHYDYRDTHAAEDRERDEGGHALEQADEPEPVDEERAAEDTVDEDDRDYGADADVDLEEDLVEKGSDEAAAADAAALFSLPLPELRDAAVVEPAALPEKREGGEAAVDPSAQATLTDHAAPAGTATAATTAAAAITAALRDNDAVDAKDARDLRDYLRAPPHGPLQTAAWIGGCVLLGVALLAQIVHANRGDLVLHPRFGAFVTGIYDALGIEVTPNWRVSDYRVIGRARLIEMPGGEETPGKLRFIAVIANRAERPQPPPLVRLTLRDRWGDATGVRDFTPPEYLSDRAMVGQLLEPGQRVRVMLNLREPGARVDGFAMELCLPDHEGTLRCASDAGTAPADTG